MTDKELRRLSRQELLRLLLQEERENQRLRQEVQQLRARLDDKTVTIANAGSIAEAALALNGVFESAQKAADQYLENVRAAAADGKVMIAETEKKCQAMIADAQRRSQQIWEENRRKLDAYVQGHQEVQALLQEVFRKDG